MTCFVGCVQFLQQQPKPHEINQNSQEERTKDAICSLPYEKNIVNVPQKDSCNGLEKRVACTSDKRSISLNEFSANVVLSHRIPSTHTEIIARYFEPILR